MGTALVTGFPGFIGRRLVRTLLAEGHDVIALVEPRMVDTARELGGSTASRSSPATSPSAASACPTTTGTG